MKKKLLLAAALLLSFVALRRLLPFERRVRVAAGPGRASEDTGAASPQASAQAEAGAVSSRHPATPPSLRQRLGIDAAREHDWWRRIEGVDEALVNLAGLAVFLGTLALVGALLARWAI